MFVIGNIKRATVCRESYDRMGICKTTKQQVKKNQMCLRQYRESNCEQGCETSLRNFVVHHNAILGVRFNLICSIN